MYDMYGNNLQTNGYPAKISVTPATCHTYIHTWKCDGTIFNIYPVRLLLAVHTTTAPQVSPRA